MNYGETEETVKTEETTTAEDIAATAVYVVGCILVGYIYFRGIKVILTGS